jgi:hypothetical protein
MSSIFSRALPPLTVAGLVLVIAGAAASCRKSDHYCPGATLDNCNYLDAVRACTGDADCTEPTAVCDLGGSNACVQCLAPDQTAACGGGTPVCGDDHACRACRAHAECPASSTCLPDGTCADPAQVAYVQAGAAGAQPCAKAAPCGTLQEAVTAVGASRPYIKIAGPGTLAAAAATTIDGKAVTILADPGAKLDRTGDGPVLVVRSATANVSIYDLEVTGQTGLADAALQLEPNGGAPMLALVRVKLTGNQGRGIFATGGTLAVTQSTISGNTGGGIAASGGSLTVSQSTISGNTGGGIAVMNGTFVIVGNVFVANGSPMGSLGGVVISTTQNVDNRLNFNSFNSNQTQSGVGAAIHCIAGAFTARNNIMSENGTLTNLEQVGGTCTHAYSIARPGTLPAGPGNSSADPLFVNTTTGDLHLKPGSPALGAADPSSSLTGVAERDLDGDLRTAPADLGADEVP